MKDKTRRTVFKAALGVAATAATAASVAMPELVSRPRLSNDELKARFNDPTWNRETTAKLEADIAPGKFVNGYVTGTVMGVRENEPVKELFGFEVFSAIRVLKQPNGDYQRLCRELIFYRNLKTGELMDSWNNPYTNEEVRVVDVANDPFNYRISDFYPDPPSYGGLNTEKRPRRPFIRNWTLITDDVVVLSSDIHLYYRNALDPAKWVRESAGPMNRVSELFRYVIQRDDLENDSLTHIPHTGVWNRITPWLPWMLMGTSPGHIVYAGTFTSVAGIDSVPKNVATRVLERFPTYVTAPEEWVDPSFSSLENYARTQTPAKPK
jgi:hypothetical protein